MNTRAYPFNLASGCTHALREPERAQFIGLFASGKRMARNRNFHEQEPRERLNDDGITNGGLRGA